MSQDIQQQTYRGVKCLHCKQPIPISPLIASIETDVRDDETAIVKHEKCQVFNLRCLACGKEKPYKVGEIIEFEGAPSSIKPSAEPSASFRQFEKRARAANG